MSNFQYIERLVNLLDPTANRIFHMSIEDAIEILGTGDAQRMRQVEGHFALVHREERTVRMARTIGRPMRYFLAKQVDGPCLVVAERIDEIWTWLKDEGLSNQFHPSYTRMVPAHHVVEISLLGCPDPNPKYRRFFEPKRNQLPADLDEIGRLYIGTLQNEINKWLDHIPETAPIGVLFSGGIDSGAVFCTIYDSLLKRGESPSRLKAFTLCVDGEAADVKQAMAFLDSMGLGMFLEVVDVPTSAINYREAIAVIEDYKPLDVQAATMTLALCRAIRQRYPDWTYLCDGDGGDENLKDYPIEENSELTIRSVLNNTMLYQEGWGVDAIKHSLTYSGGQSRGHVRTSAPTRALGFEGFSPFALPNVIEVAEGIPFIQLTQWDNDRLYKMKGDVVRSGVRQITGLEMPAYEKRRFQHGVMPQETFNKLFPVSENAYRNSFRELFA
ncbi:MAG: asparagine synthase-related protein [Pirellulaceae bacterium]